MKVQKVWSNLRKYQKLALLERSHHPCIIRCFSIPRMNYDSDSEDYSPVASCNPCDVPQGYLAVYVGPGRFRYLMKTDYLNHPLMRELLDKCEQEFGFNHTGGLTIPCEVEAFENLMWQLSKGRAESGAPNLTLAQLFNIQAD